MIGYTWFHQRPQVIFCSANQFTYHVESFETKIIEKNCENDFQHLSFIFCQHWDFRCV